MKKFLTVQEVQDLLEVSRGTIIAWIRSGRLRAFKVGGGRLWRIREADLKRFIRGDSDVAASSAADATSATE
jgi:excisionase family DNA binding protein